MCADFQISCRHRRCVAAAVSVGLSRLAALLVRQARKAVRAAPRKGFVADFSWKFGLRNAFRKLFRGVFTGMTRRSIF